MILRSNLYFDFGRQFYFDFEFNFDFEKLVHFEVYESVAVPRFFEVHEIRVCSADNSLLQFSTLRFFVYQLWSFLFISCGEYNDIIVILWTSRHGGGSFDVPTRPSLCYSVYSIYKINRNIFIYFLLSSFFNLYIYNYPTNISYRWIPIYFEQ